MSVLGKRRALIGNSGIPSWAFGADEWYDWTNGSGSLLKRLLSGDQTHPSGIGFGSQLTTGVAGFYKVNIIAIPGAGINGRLVALSDGTSNNRQIIMSLEGKYGAASSGLLTGIDTVTTGIHTIVFAISNGYRRLELVGGAQLIDNPNNVVWPSSMFMIGINTDGWASDQNLNATPMRIALKFGSQSDATYNAMRKSALKA